MRAHRFPSLLFLMLMLILLPLATSYAQREPATPPPGADSTDEIDMEDWIELEGDGVTVMAPPEFEGGSIEDMLDLLDATESVLEDDYAALVAAALNNPDLYRLFAYAPTLTDDGVLTNFSVVGTPFPLDIPMDSVLELSSAAFPDSVEMVSSDVIELGDYEEVGRMEIAMEVMRQEQLVVSYVFQIDDALYTVSFTTGVSAYKEMRPIFEQIASTLELTDDR